MVFEPLQMVKGMKVSGFKISNMVTEPAIMPITTNTLVCGFEAISMDRER